GGRERAHGRARPALRRRRGIPAAAGDRELPAAPERARGDRGQDRGRAAAVQRRRALVRQRERDRSDEHRRGHARLRAEAVLRDRRALARSAAGRLPGAAFASRRLTPVVSWFTIAAVAAATA